MKKAFPASQLPTLSPKNLKHLHHTKYISSQVTRMNYFLVQLSIADILTTALTLLPEIGSPLSNLLPEIGIPLPTLLPEIGSPLLTLLPEIGIPLSTLKTWTDLKLLWRRVKS